MMTFRNSFYSSDDLCKEGWDYVRDILRSEYTINFSRDNLRYCNYDEKSKRDSNIVKIITCLKQQLQKILKMKNPFFYLEKYYLNTNFQ